jgi:hypothetical protein
MSLMLLDLAFDFQSARGERVDRLLPRRKISSPADIRPLLQFGSPNRSSFPGHDDGLGAEEEPTRRLSCAHNVDDDACTSGRVARLGPVRLFAHPVELTDGLVIVRSRGVELH